MIYCRIRYKRTIRSDAQRNRTAGRIHNFRTRKQNKLNTAEQTATTILLRTKRVCARTREDSPLSLLYISLFAALLTHHMT